MTLFDLLFIVLALAAVVSLVVAAGAALTGHRRTAGRVLMRLAGAAVTYLAVVYAVALASSAPVLALGEDNCSDDWCMAVTAVREVPDAAERTYDVTFRLSSRARRVSQRERGVLVYMRDAGGRRYEGESGPADAPFDVQLGPSETVTTHRRFVLPPGAAARDVVLTRGGIPFPACFIIGEASELLHPAAVRIR
jgi:hypothetical protein